MRGLFKTLNCAIALSAILVAILLGFISFPIFGNKALIVHTTSMEPAVKKGDLLIVNFKNEIKTPQNFPIYMYKLGEKVVLQDTTNPNILVTNRIVKRQIQNNIVYYSTIGDDYHNQDISLASQDRIVGRYLVNIPKFGDAIEFAKKENRFLSLVTLTAFFATSLEILKSINRYKDVKKAKTNQLSQAYLENKSKLTPALFT